METSQFRKRILASSLAVIGLGLSVPAFAATPGSMGEDFYNLPQPLPAGVHGDLISYRPATVQLGAGAPAVNAWNVTYLTEDSDGGRQVATGTVLVPTSAAPNGAREVILYGVGVHGMANRCAPSRQLASGGEYEAANIAAALTSGYAVLMTDYVGYTNGSTPRSLAGASQGRNLLDMFKAARGIPGVGFEANAKTAIWGYSQGGQTAAFAAELQPSYAPGINLVAVAHGGSPGDFFRTAEYLNQRNGAAFLFSAISGLSLEYPFEIPFDLVISPAGVQAFNELKGKCIFEALFAYQNQDVALYTSPGFTLEKMLSIKGIRDTLAEQTLGKTKVSVPMYQYHGRADEFIPLDQSFVTKRAYCSKGTDVTFDVYPSEHIATQFQAAPFVLSWLGDRFAGKPTQGTCSNTAPEPITTANDNTGNIKVSLVKWPLAATVDLKTLKQTVVLPAASTFSEETDINAQTLTGVLTVPPFKQSLKLLGIGAQIGLSIQSAGEASGKVALSEAGRLTVQGQVPVDITVTSVWGIPFGQCKTATPVNFPLNFEGPISSLGNGNLTFKGTTSFPLIKGCIISAIISAFMSGNGQAYTFTVSPPAPTRY